MSIREQIYNRTNSEGKKFLEIYYKFTEFLGVEEAINSREEFFAIYKSDSKLNVLCLPEAHTGYGPCYFGSLAYFAKVASKTENIDYEKLMNKYAK